MKEEGEQDDNFILVYIELISASKSMIGWRSRKSNTVIISFK